MAAPSGATPILGLPYPIPNDDVDVPRDIKALSDKLDLNKQLRAASVLASAPVLDVGQLGQARAGRQLAVADFTAMGLSPPLGLWNLSDLTNLGSDGRALTNKGVVPFGVGVNGQAVTAAAFAGSTAQALYISDSGAADPFRIRTGSWGCWLRTAKRGVEQALLSKWPGALGQRTWLIEALANNVAGASLSSTGSDIFSVVGTTDVCDERWHFLVATHDGTKLRLYVDGVLEGQGVAAVSIFGGSAPLNVGGVTADSTTATQLPHYGRTDEAFVLGDVLSDEQVRNLYCASVTHGLGVAPTTVSLSVRRKRRGVALAVSDFPAQPVRLYNFAAGALTDQGSGNVPVVANPGTGSITDVAAPDGSAAGAKSFLGAHTGLSATDAGLPAALTPRSYGAWFKISNVASVGIFGWGTAAADARLATSTPGAIVAASGADQITGPFVTDGLWHFVAVVEDNAAADGLKRKLYLDGRLVGGSTVLTSLTLAGANRLRVGANPDGTVPMAGQVDGAFIYAGALTGEQVRALYNAGPTLLAASPKAPADHIETLEATRVLATFDSLETSDAIDLGVVA